MHYKMFARNMQLQTPDIKIGDCNPASEFSALQLDKGVSNLLTCYFGYRGMPC